MEWYSSRFTSPEGGARLAATAALRNTLAVEYAAFVSTRLLYEDAYKIRGSLRSGKQRSIYVTRASRVPSVAYHLTILTDLRVTKAVSIDLANNDGKENAEDGKVMEGGKEMEDVTEDRTKDVESVTEAMEAMDLKDDGNVARWAEVLENNEVLVCTSSVFQYVLEQGVLCMRQINVLVLDSCHLIYKDTHLQYIMQMYKQCDESKRPRILALTHPLFTSNKHKRDQQKHDMEQVSASPQHPPSIPPVLPPLNLDCTHMYESVEWNIQQLEEKLCCTMDLAEDIDLGKRSSAVVSKPRELVIEFSAKPCDAELAEPYRQLDKFIRDTVNDALDFINEHRYDPTEIYGEEMYEELVNIPDPTVDPRNLMHQLLYVLDQMGPYAADKAAFTLLTKLEKLKIKVPYERHFLLLCLCTTVLVKIRSAAEEAFNKVPDPIQAFSTHKVLRLAEILVRFRPERDTSETARLMSEIDKCDFATLGDKLEDKVNSMEAGLKEIEPVATVRGRGRGGGRVRGRARGACVRARASGGAAAESLCGLVLLRTALAANILFMLVADLSRSNPLLSYISALYCAADSAPRPGTEPGECHKHNKKQEDVLKKFRMHECNLLLATPALGEGIDLPRCNLVLLWDAPVHWRSYALSRGRARAPRATCALMCQPETIPASIPGTIPESIPVETISTEIMDKAADTLGEKASEVIPVEKENISIPETIPAETAVPEEIVDKENAEKVENKAVLSNETIPVTKENISIPISKEIPVSPENTVPMNVVSTDKPKVSVPMLSNKPVLLESAVSTVPAPVSGDVTVPHLDKVLNTLATYRELDQIISRKCGCGIQDEPTQSEEEEADLYTHLIKPYTTKRRTDTSDKDKSDIKDSEKDKKDSDQRDNSDIKDSEKDKSDTKDKKDSDIKDKDKSETVNDNLTCNKCNTKRSSVSVVCKCAEGDGEGASVDLSTAIALINRYCGKLPSDTFTRLAPQWWMEEVYLPADQVVGGGGDSGGDGGGKVKAYVCTLRLPLNCPVKYNIVGHPMLTRVLARRVAALQAVRVLHTTGELDDQLMPIGKENFKAAEVEGCGWWKTGASGATANAASGASGAAGATAQEPGGDARPGTTKRRQYYYKRTAWAFTDCQPVIDTSDSELDPPVSVHIDTNRHKSRHTDRHAEDSDDAEDIEMLKSKQSKGFSGKRNMLYALECVLWCALPERYNTRGRRLHAPHTAKHAVAILMARSVGNSAGNAGNSGESAGKSGESAGNDSSTNKKHSDSAINSDYSTDNNSETSGHSENNSVRTGNSISDIGSVSSDYSVPKDHSVKGSASSMELRVPSFPVYTRSGEVRVSVNHVPDADVRLSPKRAILVRRFMKFVFSGVLRVRRRGMRLAPDAQRRNDYYIVPTTKTTRADGSTKIDIDWPFLELIYQHTEEQKFNDIDRPVLFSPDESDKDSRKEKAVKRMDNPLLKPGEVFVFDTEKYKEAVVTPWYRNQDQPQFFLVAEICWNLTPDSAFPSASHLSFRDYYLSKYGVTLTQADQPLLDVDHTSARLNLLTPRYVNRKGVALPVSSERTRRAKRDRLDQKQILVPELCALHPFAAPLWAATVALPCLLYRINALLIADEIRRSVAIHVGLGLPAVDDVTCPGFTWPPLDFGWSLAEVLNADTEKNDKKKETENKEQNSTEHKEKEEKDDSTEEKGAEENTECAKEKTINDILQEKEDADNGFEIGTWSNDMASSIPDTCSDPGIDPDLPDYLKPLPPNLTLCTSASGGANWCDPVPRARTQLNPSKAFSMADSDCSYMSSDFDTDECESNSEGSSEGDTDTGFCSNATGTGGGMGVRIEYKTAHEAEAVDLQPTNKHKISAPALCPEDEAADHAEHEHLFNTTTAPQQFIEKFRASVSKHKKEIIEKGYLIHKHEPIKDILPEPSAQPRPSQHTPNTKLLEHMFPNNNFKEAISLEELEKNKRVLLEKLKKSLSEEEVRKLQCFAMRDVDVDSPNYVNEKIANVGFDSKDIYAAKVNNWSRNFSPYYSDNKGSSGKAFDFDYQPNLEGHPGPSPSVILQALTMSNANDGINLERLETIGDSFLKFAITAYLYCAHPTVHEGKLSHMRSKQVSNLNLYRLGRGKRLGARMIASKFEPHDNWLPPCHRPPDTLHQQQHIGQEDRPGAGVISSTTEQAGCFIPYNLITQHSIPDKSIADCVEALIGAYLLECGPRGALLLMAWLGIAVLPAHTLPLHDTHPYVRNHNDTQETSQPSPTPRRRTSSCSSSSSASSTAEAEDEDESAPEEDWSWPGRCVGSLKPYKDENGKWVQTVFGELKAPPSPLLRYIADPEGELERMLSGYEQLEATLQYRFRDRSLLLQALTHASHHHNTLTDCYQRLEFLGDAILDYLITRHLFEDRRRHSPGALTDLRSALVNNTIFATLAARHGFHKYFRHMSPGLNEVLTKYVKIQEENGHSISEEHYLIQEDELEQAEDVEVPKALGDLFESVAGAIFLDSGLSLGAVWRSYGRLMGAELEAFSAAAPKSPVRELLEAEPDTAKFGKPERLADGRRVRVSVEVFGRGTFKGVGRNYRIAKGTAARCALRHLKPGRPPCV